MRRSLPVLLLLAAAAVAAEPVHHDLAVRLDPQSHRIAVVDRITHAPAGDGPLRFAVHAGLKVEAVGEGVTIRAVGDLEGGAVPRKEYEVSPAATSFAVRLTGEIHHPLQQEAQEYARSFSRTPGLIDEQGVVLFGATAWVPAFGDELVTFKLTVALPDGWRSLSQGALSDDGTTWTCSHPMDEVYLIAAPFTVYDGAVGKVKTYAFLRTPDPALAAKYLETTAQYVEMYRQLLGPYPFGKFALVENFWETGYGMPSFTLLGPQIIRFPFILHSSYPHEILHNWWGNSVYVDWETGNWCEGLTAYLADHLIREGHGGGEAYRRDTLKKYRAYVRGEGDFPLREFRSRHSSATEAVGYGKSLMLFHMLRIRLGDATFARGLQTFFRQFKFKRASFDDLATVFSDVAGEDLKPYFKQWVERTGAPALALEEKVGALLLKQTQAGELYDLRVPVAYTVGDKTELTSVHLKERAVRLEAPAGATRVDVDPYFDVFRLLDRREMPPTLGEVFGAEKVTIVLPKEGWRELAEAWKGEQVEVVAEDAIEALPSDRAVWILGKDNKWADKLGLAVDTEGGIRVGAAAYPVEGHSFVFAAAHPGNPELTAGWIFGSVPAALPGLARKLPHYGKYSYLAFAGDEPANVAKGQWPATSSPLVWHADRPRGELPKREPLARLAPVFDEQRLMAHVRWLADDARRGRGADAPEQLDACADYIGNAFKEAGLKPGGQDGWFQTWTEPGGPDGKPVTLRNVVGVLPGTDEKWAKQSVVVGAHYDHLGLGWPDVREGHRGKIHNGADDNASGVAVLLELGKILGGHRPKRTIVFVAFSGEEWGRKGSQHYVRTMQRWPAAQGFAMVNLDTVGRLQGKKLTMLGSGTASEWKHIAMGVGYTTGVEAVCIPQDPGGSDQVSFHEMGVPAVQLFSGMHTDYHRSTDEIGKVDGAGLVKVATFTRETLVYLGEREQPMTSTLGDGTKPVKPAAGAGRRVSLGTMPDFAFAGPGVKVNSVIEGSPAHAAGVREGDVLLAIDADELKDLRAFSEALKARKPGDTIRIRLRRGDEELTLEATLKAR